MRRRRLDVVDDCDADEGRVRSGGERDLRRGERGERSRGQGGPGQRRRSGSVHHRHAAPSVEAQITAIEDLPVPAGEEEQVSAIVDAVNQGLDEAEADPAALTKGADPFAEANQLANDYGMTDCGG